MFVCFCYGRGLDGEERNTWWMNFGTDGEIGGVEYSLNLQPKQKWQAPRKDLKINNVALPQEDLASRSEWKMARVIGVYLGVDSKMIKVRLLVSETTFDKHGKQYGKDSFTCTEGCCFA